MSGEFEHHVLVDSRICDHTTTPSLRYRYWNSRPAVCLLKKRQNFPKIGESPYLTSNLLLVGFRSTLSYQGSHDSLSLTLHKIILSRRALHCVSSLVVNHYNIDLKMHDQVRFPPVRPNGVQGVESYYYTAGLGPHKKRGRVGP